MKQFGDIQSSQGRLLGSFEDNGVSTSESRANFPSKHEKRKVPRDDLACNTDWLVQDLNVVRSVSRHCQSMDFIRPTYIHEKQADSHEFRLFKRHRQLIFEHKMYMYQHSNGIVEQTWEVQLSKLADMACHCPMSQVEQALLCFFQPNQQNAVLYATFPISVNHHT